MRTENNSNDEIHSGDHLRLLLIELKKSRKAVKIIKRKRSRLSKQQRYLILSKTDSRCHICGSKLTIDGFQADHVKAHSTGGVHVESNYLPACSVCNNYRWHYSSEEIQLILKLGVWTKTKIVTDPVFGKEMANRFVKHEMGVRKRRVGKK